MKKSTFTFATLFTFYALFYLSLIPAQHKSGMQRLSGAFYDSTTILSKYATIVFKGATIAAKDIGNVVLHAADNVGVSVSAISHSLQTVHTTLASAL